MEEGSPGVESHLYMGVSFRCCCIIHGHIFTSTIVEVKEQMLFFVNSSSLLLRC